jgi:hypothetical protein
MPNPNARNAGSSSAGAAEGSESVCLPTERQSKRPSMGNVLLDQALEGKRSPVPLGILPAPRHFGV